MVSFFYLHLHLNPILEYNETTLEDVRRNYDLDKPERLKEALDILEKWVKEQKHFKNKNFSRSYLENTLLPCKGSLEKTKKRIDKMCTFRSLLPQYFGEYDLEDFKDIQEGITLAYLPKLTPDHYRILLAKVSGSRWHSNLMLQVTRLGIIYGEYLKAHECADGYIVIIDYRELDIVEHVRHVNPIDLKHGLEIITEGIGVRVRAIHLLTSSKYIELIVNLLKSLLSAKLGGRVQVHSSVDTLYDSVPKDILPKEYGGKEMPLKELEARRFLEATILSCKGSLEKAKGRIDKMCAFKTLFPQYFGVYTLKDFDRFFEVITLAVLPKKEPKLNRVLVLRARDISFYPDIILDAVRLCVLFGEYMKVHDVADGYIFVCDYRKLNVLNAVKYINLIDLRHGMTILTDCLGCNVRGIHMITTSKYIELLLNIFKQAVSAKIANRLYVHKSVESVHEVIPREILPRELGGKEESVEELHEKWNKLYFSEEHRQYMEVMNACCTDESLRPTDVYNDQYMGMPGTFRSLSVD